MNKILLFTILTLYSFNLFSQAKLITTSGYNYNTASSVYELSDSSLFFYKPINPTFSGQNIEDGYVTSKEDSTWAFGMNGTNLTLNAKWFNEYNPTYNHKVVYRDTIYGGSIPLYSNKVDYFHNGIHYDSSISKQTVISTNTTITNQRTYYHQNALNQLDTFWYVYYNQSGAYTSTSKQTVTYNANNLTLATYSYSSSDSINYIPDSRIDYFYGPTNLLDSMVVFVYQANMWYKAGKREYTYNANNQKIKMEYKGFNQVSQQYEPTARDEYVRSNGVEMDSLYSQLWSSGFNVYDTTVKKGYIYSANLLTKVYTFTKDAITKNWIPNPYGAINNYYYDMVLSVGNTQKESTRLTLYPNPVSNELHILENFPQASYSIISTDGKLIRHGILNAQHQISIESISKGSYFLILETNGQTISRTFQKL
jgi:hypothetical protein